MADSHTNWSQLNWLVPRQCLQSGTPSDCHQVAGTQLLETTSYVNDLDYLTALDPEFLRL